MNDGHRFCGSASAPGKVALECGLAVSLNDVVEDGHCQNFARAVFLMCTKNIGLTRGRFARRV